MKMKCILCAVAALTMCSTTLTAASAEEKENVEFKRHWFLQVQAGAAYTLGEVDFGERPQRCTPGIGSRPYGVCASV